MKIQNPTVFLDNGELKCLTVEVPKEPEKAEQTLCELAILKKELEELKKKIKDNIK